MSEDLSYPIGRFKRPVEVTERDTPGVARRHRRRPGGGAGCGRGLADAQLDTPYRPDGWTVRQLVHHLPDSHLNAYVRCKLALTEDEPAIKTYEEKDWAELPEAKTAPPEVSLALLAALHARRALLPRDSCPPPPSRVPRSSIRCGAARALDSPRSACTPGTGATTWRTSPACASGWGGTAGRRGREPVPQPRRRRPRLALLASGALVRAGPGGRTRRARRPRAAHRCLPAQRLPGRQAGRGGDRGEDGKVLHRKATAWPTSSSAYRCSPTWCSARIGHQAVHRHGRPDARQDAASSALDDPITKHLADYPTQGQKITIEHLLTHTSGIPSYTDMPGWMPSVARHDREAADRRLQGQAAGVRTGREVGLQQLGLHPARRDHREGLRQELRGFLRGGDLRAARA